MTAFKAILCDLDNTLLDFLTLKKSAVQAALEAMIATGLQTNMTTAKKALDELFIVHGWEHQQIFQLFLEKITGKIDHKILCAGIVAYRREKIKHVRTYPQVIPTLQELRKRGYKLGIVTDASNIQAWIRLHELGLQDMFDTVVTHECTGQKKPHILPFQQALKNLNVEPFEALHIGDWPARDVAGAKTAGLKAALAKYGLSEELKNDNIIPDYILEKFEDILSIAR